MVFEPITGSFAALAVIDVGMRTFSWTYGKYRLGKQFGTHLVAYEIIYKSEVLRFEMTRDQIINSVDDETRPGHAHLFAEVVRERLVLLLDALEECEHLVESHDEKKISEDVSAQQDVARHKNDISHSPLEPSSVLESPGAPAVSPLRSGSATPSLSRVIATTRSEIATPKKSSGIRRLLPTRKKPKPPTPTSSNLEFTRQSLQETELRLREQQHVHHSASTVSERLKWISDERDRFIELLKIIKGHNEYFISLLNVTYMKITMARHDPLATSTASEKVHNVGTHLSRLVKAISALPDGRAINIQLMLRDDPFALWSELSRDHPSSQFLRPASSLFAAQWRNLSPETTAAQSTIPEEVTPIFFEVPLNKTARLISSQPIPATSPQVVRSFAELRHNATEAAIDFNEEGYCRPIGDIRDILTITNEPIRVLLDQTPYQQKSKTLSQAMNDPEEPPMAKKRFLAHRFRLAYIIASSLLHFVVAGYPNVYKSESMHYYLASEAISANDLAERLVTPYLPLQAVTSIRSSSAALLRNAAATVSNELILIRSLGVVLYEIGAWKTIPSMTEQDWRARTAAAQRLLLELVKSTTVRYLDVVRTCLEWTPTEDCSGDYLAQWLDTQVVSQLKNMKDTLPPEFKTG